MIRAPVRAPRANAHAERWVRTLRRECLDSMLVLGRRHLERVVRDTCATTTSTGRTARWRSGLRAINRARRRCSRYRRPAGATASAGWSTSTTLRPDRLRPDPPPRDDRRRAHAGSKRLARCPHRGGTDGDAENSVPTSATEFSAPTAAWSTIRATSCSLRSLSSRAESDAGLRGAAIEADRAGGLPRRSTLRGPSLLLGQAPPGSP